MALRGGRGQHRETVLGCDPLKAAANLRALKLLAPGGLLVTCSCSHHLSEAALLDIVAAAARDARRELRILERRGQALDHPVLETAYLKCIIARAG